LERDPLVLMKYSKEELIRYIVMSDLTPKMQQLFNAVKAGDYNTRFLLAKVFGAGQVDDFIKLGLTRKFLKQDWILKGKRKKALLSIIDPLENLHNKAEIEPKLIA
jgi:hypothetical protein